MEALTDNDTNLRVLRLIELIAHINSTIQQHRRAAQSRPEVIGEYLYRRAEYLAELTELMDKGYAIRAELRPIDQLAV